jgi:hypothetical protein
MPWPDSARATRSRSSNRSATKAWSTPSRASTVVSPMRSACAREPAPNNRAISATPRTASKKHASSHAIVRSPTKLRALSSPFARTRAPPRDLEHGVSLGRSIVGLLPENVWALLAIALASVLTIAIVVRSRVTVARAKVAATTTCAVTGALLAITALCAWAARDARLHLREGVVVTPNARLLDERHVVRDAVAPIAEATRVRVVEEGAGYSRVHVAGQDGWLPSSAVLPIAKR